MKQTPFALVLLFLFHQQLCSQRSFHFSEDVFEYSGFSKRKCVDIRIIINDELETKLSKDRIKRSVESLCYNILPDDMIYGDSYSEQCADYYREQYKTNKITSDDFLNWSRNWNVIVDIDGGLLRTDSFYGKIVATISADNAADIHIKYRSTQKKRNEEIDQLLAQENNTYTREKWNEALSTWTTTRFYDVVIFSSASIYTGYKPYDLLPIVNRHVRNVLEELNVAIRKYP